MKIKPLADRVLVEPVAAESKTASGIIIPDTAKERPMKGTIVAVDHERVRYFCSYLIDFHWEKSLIISKLKE
jgi:co-chaperonin GroES (HSP10)